MQLVRAHTLEFERFASWMGQWVEHTTAAPRTRHVLGAVVTSGVTPDQVRLAAERMVRYDKLADQQADAYGVSVETYVAIENDGRHCYGLVRALKGFLLSRVRGPFPLELARVIPALRQNLPLLPDAVQVVAETMPGSEGHLPFICRQTVALLGSAARAWAIEPEYGSEARQAHIRNAGFSVYDNNSSARYATVLDTHGIPPLSQLYVTGPIFDPDA